MTYAHLAACPACSRHVRVTEIACPFCGGALADAFRSQIAPVPLTVRLSRAALLALGTGTLSLAAACGGATLGAAGDAGGEDARASEAPDGASAVYDSGNEGYDSSNTNVPYGQPPPPPEDAGTEPPPVDASVHDAPFIAPPYGLPP